MVIFLSEVSVRGGGDCLLFAYCSVVRRKAKSIALFKSYLVKYRQNAFLPYNKNSFNNILKSNAANMWARVLQTCMIRVISGEVYSLK